VELDAPILHVASGDPAGAGQEEAGGTFRFPKLHRTSGGGRHRVSGGAEDGEAVGETPWEGLLSKELVQKLRTTIAKGTGDSHTDSCSSLSETASSPHRVKLSKDLVRKLRATLAAPRGAAARAAASAVAAGRSDYLAASSGDRPPYLLFRENSDLTEEDGTCTFAESESIAESGRWTPSDKSESPVAPRPEALLAALSHAAAVAPPHTGEGLQEILQLAAQDMQGGLRVLCCLGLGEGGSRDSAVAPSSLRLARAGSAVELASGLPARRVSVDQVFEGQASRAQLFCELQKLASIAAAGGCAALVTCGAVKGRGEPTEAGELLTHLLISEVFKLTAEGRARRETEVSLCALASDQAGDIKDLAAGGRSLGASARHAAHVAALSPEHLAALAATLRVRGPQPGGSSSSNSCTAVTLRISWWLPNTPCTGRLGEGLSAKVGRLAIVDVPLDAGGEDAASVEAALRVASEALSGSDWELESRPSEGRWMATLLREAMGGGAALGAATSPSGSFGAAVVVAAEPSATTQEEAVASLGALRVAREASMRARMAMVAGRLEGLNSLLS